MKCDYLKAMARKDSWHFKHHCVGQPLLAEVLVIFEVFFVDVGLDEGHKLIRALLHTHLGGECHKKQCVKQDQFTTDTDCGSAVINDWE